MLTRDQKLSVSLLSATPSFYCKLKFIPEKAGSANTLLEPKRSSVAKRAKAILDRTRILKTDRMDTKSEMSHVSPHAVGPNIVRKQQY